MTDSNTHHIRNFVWVLAGLAVAAVAVIGFVRLVQDPKTGEAFAGLKDKIVATTNSITTLAPTPAPVAEAPAPAAHEAPAPAAKRTVPTAPASIEPSAKEIAGAAYQSLGGAPSDGLPIYKWQQTARNDFDSAPTCRDGRKAVLKKSADIAGPTGTRYLNRRWFCPSARR